MINQTNGVWSSQWAGQNSRQVQEGQDGHTNDNAVNQLNDILDVEEVTIVAVNNTAEFARVGYMNMVTKSGTNQFHGRALYWHQNSAVGARSFFETTKAKTLIHTSSVGLSGPIIKNKLFFYASANILKVPSKQFYLQSVPTERMRGGDFLAVAVRRKAGDHQRSDDGPAVSGKHHTCEPNQRCFSKNEPELSARSESRRSR